LYIVPHAGKKECRKRTAVILSRKTKTCIPESGFVLRLYGEKYA
jgi:hypothetical protein